MTLNRGAFSLEVEGMAPRLETIDATQGPTGAFRTGFAYYGQVSYGLRNGVTPFARFEQGDPDRDTRDDEEQTIVVGVNYALTPSVFLKTEVLLSSFAATTEPSTTTWLSSIAVAF